MAKLTPNAVARALTASHGNISAAARALGVVRSAIQQRIAKDPELVRAVIDARESMVDNAESALARAVLAGEAWAVCFTLKTQGKARGYIERHEHTGKDGQSLYASLSDEELDRRIAEVEERLAGAQRGKATPNGTNGRAH